MPPETQQNHCFLREIEIDVLIQVITKPVNKNIRSIITNYYTIENDDLPSSENFMALIKEVRQEMIYNSNHAKDFKNQSFETVQKIKNKSQEILEIFKKNGDYVVEIYESTFTCESEFDLNSQKICNMMTQIIDASKKIESLPTVMTAKRGKGRQSIAKFKEFIYHNARLYEELSGEKFKIDRFKNSKNKYEAITDGHKYIEIITKAINKNFSKHAYSPANLITAAEEAVTRLKKERHD